MKTTLIALFAILLTGCATSRQSTSITPDQAKTLATSLSNDKAFAVYGCRPFQNGQPAIFIGGRWVWSDLGGVSCYDLEATVVLAADGSTNQVELKALYNKEDRAQTTQAIGVP